MPIDEVLDELIALLVMVEVDEVEVDEDVLMAELERLDSEIKVGLDVIHIDDDDEVELIYKVEILLMLAVDEMAELHSQIISLEV